MVSGGYSTRLNPEDPSQMISKMNGNGAVTDNFKISLQYIILRIKPYCMKSMTLLQAENHETIKHC